MNFTSVVSTGFFVTILFSSRLSGQHQSVFIKALDIYLKIFKHILCSSAQMKTNHNCRSRPWFSQVHVSVFLTETNLYLLFDLIISRTWRWPTKLVSMMRCRICIDNPWPLTTKQSWTCLESRIKQHGWTKVHKDITYYIHIYSNLHFN